MHNHRKNPNQNLRTNQMSTSISNRKKLNLGTKRDKVPSSHAIPKSSTRNQVRAKPIGCAVTILTLTLLTLGVTRYAYSVVEGYQKAVADSDKRFQMLAADHLATLAARVDDFELDPREAQNRGEEALSFAGSLVLDSTQLQSRFADLHTPHAELRNVALNVVASRSSPSLRYADVSVTNSDGAFVEGLTRDDFEAFLGERRLSAVTVTRCDVSNEAHAIAILRDKSASTSGLADTFAGEAIRACVTSLADPSRIRIYNFADTVTTLTPLTSDRSLLLSSLVPNEPGGGTALYRAIRSAISDLLTRKERRSLIVFTDGNDSFENESVEGLIAGAKKSETRIFVVGLKSPSLNESVLKQIASGTGGRYFSAENPQALVKNFQVVTKSFQRPVYRVVALHAEDSEAPLRLEVADAKLLIPKQN